MEGFHLIARGIESHDCFGARDLPDHFPLLKDRFHLGPGEEVFL